MMTQPLRSFDQLVERYRPELLAYVMRLLGNNHDAEDVCQDAFLRAYRAFDRLEANSNTRAWLYRIMTNTALNFIKRRRQAMARAVDMDPESISSSTGGDTERRDRLERIAQAVKVLPPKQRAALMQRQFQGLSYEEIAEALGCSAESARANVYQAIKKLRSALDPQKNR
jgi:RNA polymerase sigma-70 factor (ECF subfamily)